MSIVMQLSANRCNVCFMHNEISKKLFVCNGCKLIMYCSRDHQIEDWPAHKRLCLIIRNIIHFENISPPHPFFLSGPITSRFQLEKAVIQLKFLVNIAMGSDFDPCEQELITFPRCCPVCYEFEIKDNQNDCPDCKVITYCSTKHRNDDHLEHKKICNYLILIYNYYVVPTFKLDFNFQNPTSTIEILNETHLFNLLRKCNTTPNIEIPTEPKTLKEYQIFVKASSFSFIATILYTLHLCRVHEYVGDTITIYVVSFKLDETNIFKYEHCSFLLTNLPRKIRHVRIYLMSPSLSCHRTSMTFNIRTNGEQRTVEIIYRAGYYQDIIALLHKSNINHKYPNLIVLFDSSNEGVNQDMWSASIEQILKSELIPILFTTLLKREALSILNYFKNTAQQQSLYCDIVANCRINPFKYYVPSRNAVLIHDDEPICFYNNYMNIIMTKSFPDKIQDGFINYVAPSNVD